MTSADPVLEVFLLSFIVRTINVELENIWKTRNPENFVWAEYLGCPPKVVAVSLLGRDDTYIDTCGVVVVWAASLIWEPEPSSDSDADDV